MYLGSGTGYCVINKGPGITGTATRLYFGEDSDSGLTMFRGTGNVTVSSANVGIKELIRLMLNFNFWKVYWSRNNLTLIAINSALRINAGTANFKYTLE